MPNENRSILIYRTAKAKFKFGIQLRMSVGLIDAGLCHAIVTTKPHSGVKRIYSIETRLGNNNSVT